MGDYSLVPVEHQPDFSDVSLIPVDHDPFSADGVTQPAQQTQTQPQEPPQQTQSSIAGEHLPDIGPPLIGDGGQLFPGTAFGQKAADVASKVAYGMMRQVATLPQRAIDAARVSFEHNYGPGPSTLSDSDVWVDPLPSVAAETALTMMGGSRAVPVAPGMIPAAKGVVGSVAEEAGAGLRALTDVAPRSPASRAAQKGYSGIGATPKGGPTFAGTDHLYSARQGQRSIVEIKLTGSRRADDKLANEWGGFTEKPSGYMWHHVDDFDPQTGTSSLELVDKDAHWATQPHVGSVAQYEKFHGIPYKR